MPRPALLSVRARSGLAATAVVLIVGMPMSACSTVTPEPTSPTRTASAPATPEPGSTETLLPETDGDAHSAVGELVPEFPSTLIPVPDGAEVLLSSAAPVDGTDLTEVSLNLRTGQDTSGLLDAVRAPLVAAGFIENAPPAAEPGLAAQATFSRGDGSELIVVGILDRADERTLTLGGRVRSAAP
jgi:hypothetical protein